MNLQKPVFQLLLNLRIAKSCSLFMSFLLMTFYTTGCTQKIKQDTLSTPTVQENHTTQQETAQTTILEEEPNVTKTFQDTFTQVYECTLEALKNRTIPTYSSDVQKGTITTGFITVNKGELQRISSATKNPQVNYTKGMYTLRIAISPDSEQSTTVTVNAKILGYIETSLPLSRPSPWQRLPSNGILEQEIYDTILKCCQEKDK